MATMLTVEKAADLALALHGLRAGETRVEVMIEGDRIAFEAVQWRGDVDAHSGEMTRKRIVLGGHSLDIGTSTEERVLAHFWGFCANYGIEKPVEGGPVRIACGSAKSGSRVATVERVGRRQIRVRGKYKHGGAFERSVRIGSCATVKS